MTQTLEPWCGPSIVCTGDFIRSPFIYQCDLTEAPAVRQLASDPAYSGLHKLLTVMLAGDITGKMIPTYWTGLDRSGHVRCAFERFAAKVIGN